MKAVRRAILILLVVAIVFSIASLTAFASVRPFDSGSSGGGDKIQRPRGFAVALKDGTTSWMVSKYIVPAGDKNQSPTYTGTDAGLSYMNADDLQEVRAFVSNGVQNGYMFVAAVSKNASADGMAAINVGSLSPERSTAIANPNGDTYQWCTRFLTLKFDPGTYYEFYYLSGMNANNNSTCVIWKYEDEHPSGYLTFDNGTGSFKNADEQAYYDSHKYNEYYYVNWSKNADGSFNVSYLPFRYHIQTYADVSKWEDEVPNIRARIEDVGKQSLYDLLDEYDARIYSEIKYELQVDAENDIAEMISSIYDAIEKARTDLTTFNAVLAEAKELYDATKNNTGKAVGKYGAAEVQNLGAVITEAETSVDKHTDQAVVDAYVTKLRQAMEAVKASKVTKGEIRFYDPSTGIIVIAEKGSLPSKTILFVAQIASNDSIYKSVTSKMSEEPSGSVIYTIKFYANNKEVAPESPVKIQIPVISSLDAEQTSVYFVSLNGDYTTISSSLAGGTHVFTSYNMGNFGIFEFADKEEEKDDKEGNKESDKKQDVMVEDEENTGNEINEATKTEIREKQIKMRELMEDKKEDYYVPGIDLSELSQDINDDAIQATGVVVAVFGVTCGFVEVIRSRRGKNFFV